MIGTSSLAPPRYAASQSERHMSADDSPAAVGADPGLALPADLFGARDDEFGIGDPEIPPECGNALVPQHSLLIHGATPDAKRGDLGVTVLTFGFTRAEAYG